MPQTFQLQPNAGRVSLGNSGMRLRAPQLEGPVIWHSPAEHAPVLARALASGTSTDPPAADPVEQALREAGLEDQGSLSFPAAAQMRGSRDKIVVERSPGLNRVEFAIYRDESGVISLHRPLPSAPVAAETLSPAVGETARPTHHYVIPWRHIASSSSGMPPRMAMLSGIAGKVIRFVGRAATGIAGDAVYLAAKLWENHYRAAQGFHWGGTLGELLNPTPLPFTSANWAALNGKSALLFIHGTTSSTAAAFTGLQGFSAASAQLYGKYGSRVFGFNHHTLTKSVPQNALDFLRSLPPGSYQLDVISHSRGGLLARALKEMTPAELGQLVDPVWTPPSGLNLRIGKIVLTGTPDVGTPLADPTDLPKAVSRLASIATTFTQDAVAMGLGAVFAIFGGIVEGGLGALPGLEDMNPGNPFLQRLNLPPANDTDYYGIEADYQPAGGLKQAIENDGIDALFLGAANDLIVPTQGVSQVNGQTLPASQVEAYPQSANVYHMHYFYQQETWNKVLAFL